jgi:hypothetical protein
MSQSAQASGVQAMYSLWLSVSMHVTITVAFGTVRFDLHMAREKIIPQMQDGLNAIKDDPAIYLPEQLCRIQGSMIRHALDKLQGSCWCTGPSRDEAGSSTCQLALSFQ